MSTGDGYYQHGKCCCCKCNCEPKTFGPLPKQPQSSEHIKQLSEAISRVFETGNSEILPTSPQPIEKCEPVAECLICATGNDLPEGEYCRSCGRENNMTNLGRAVKYARGGNSVPTEPLLFTSPQPRKTNEEDN